jgi:hypothetical protein
VLPKSPIALIALYAACLLAVYWGSDWDWRFVVVVGAVTAPFIAYRLYVLGRARPRAPKG